ncbi:MAG: succinyl-CoA synthetase alpha subunit [Parcubacteria group bacterium Gr01-1014_107]|nr:MAG: succinyl-CoA synthetase alpha subunit [Parcubacteria group bacterium Gr01-1014_107]
MSILIDKGTTVLVQGVTGKEGSRAAKEMLSYSTRVVAGVTPGKGGIKTDDNLPVFNTVRESLAKFPDINTTLIAVPGAYALEAILEAIWNKIPLINVLTEKIPVADVARAVALTKNAGVRIVGPSSVGILVPEVVKVGSIGSSELAARVFKPGPVGVVSKSGGMTAEISRILTEADIGQSTAVGIGGDLIIGSDFVDVIMEFERDRETEAVVIFGEVGGTYEEQLAERIGNGEIKKPIVCLIAGRFAAALPEDSVLGHAGAIVSRGRGSAESKIKSLSEAGAWIAETPEEIPEIVRKLL